MKEMHMIYSDTFFERVVDLRGLVEAWRALDAELLIDLTLDLLNAEQHFHRKCIFGIDGVGLLWLSVEIAKSAQHIHILQRIKQIAKVYNLRELLNATDLPASGIPPLPTTDLHGQSIAERLQFRALQTAITRASLTMNEKAKARALKSVSGTVLDSMASHWLTTLDSARSPLALEQAAILESCLTARLIATHNDQRDQEQPNGQFEVQANARNGVLYRNFSGRHRGICFSAEGTWTYDPAQGFHGPGGHSRNVAGGNYMLPGHPAGGLIALGTQFPGGFVWVGAGEFHVSMDPFATIKFYCNDAYNGFGDNRSVVTLRWTECVWGPVNM